MNTTKIIAVINKIEFSRFIEKYRDKIKVSSHVFDHLNLAQREQFKAKDLIRVLSNENPRGIGI